MLYTELYTLLKLLQYVLPKLGEEQPEEEKTGTYSHFEGIEALFERRVHKDSEITSQKGIITADLN